MKIKKRLKLFFLFSLVCAVLSAVALYVISRPEKIYHLSISTNARAPSSLVVTDYKLGDYWLWFRERDGRESTINVHASQVIIESEPYPKTTNLYVIRENILGAGSALDSLFRGPSNGT